MARVVGGFKDPHTKRIYHVGDEYDGEHAAEFAAKGYIDTVGTLEGEAAVTPEKETPEKSDASKSKKAKG